jgi:serine/threonine protein kinase
MLDLGELIDGKYRLIRKLGQGGMGTVFEALHEQINKPVAVKVLRPQESHQGELVARFHREAQAAARAGHRGIVDIYDVGVCPDESPYLVMELLEGESLGERLDRDRQLDLTTTAYVVCQVLSALAAAHEKGVVHRDLKPENIFLVESGAALPEVKLLDFGISRVVIPGSMTRMTRSGAVMGTPQYMSPEQAAGKSDIDHRTDIFAAGIILYECLSGLLPFNGENYNALLVEILTVEPLRLREHRPELSPEVDALVWKALRKDREHRYQTATDLFAVLRPFVAPGAAASLRTPKGLAPDTVPQGEPEAPSVLSVVAELPATIMMPPLPSPRPSPAGRGGRFGLLLLILALAILVIGVTAGLAASTMSDETETSSPTNAPVRPSAPGSAGEIATPAPNSLASPIDLSTTPALDAGVAKVVKAAIKGVSAPRVPVKTNVEATDEAPRPRGDYGSELGGSEHPSPPAKIPTKVRRPSPPSNGEPTTSPRDYGAEID